MAGITENWKGRSREKEREGGGGRAERGRMEIGETAQKRDGSCVPLRSNDNVVLAYFMIKL